MILIFLDDVMRSHSKAPIYEGRDLYLALQPSKKVAVLCEDKDEAARWMKMSNYGEIAEMFDYSYITAVEDKDMALVQYCRSQGKIELVVTANVELSERLLAEGLHVLLFLHPIYMRPEFRPDGRGRRAWDAITTELDKQQLLYSEDNRV